MRTQSILLSVAVALAVIVAAAQAPGAAALRDSGCMDCHSDKTLTKQVNGREVPVFVDRAKLAASVHVTNTCVSCHADVTGKHPDDNQALKPVECATCHETQSASYGVSVHGVAAREGTPGAATCKDCHGTHDILPPGSTASPLHYSRQMETCGACHDVEARDVAASVHGKATAAGRREAPDCTDCHSEHRIEGLKSASSLRISADVCSNCHASERLNTKFNLPKDRVKTFFESYHGLASQYGSTLAANCGSCHGYHKVLPSSDPESTIHPTQLVETCGKCHPGATERFAAGRIHVDLTADGTNGDFGEQVNWWVRRVYLALIVGVIGAMLLHNGLLFYKKVAAHLRASGRPIERMTRPQRWQHAVLAMSFIILAITGFALRFPDSWLARALGSSEPFRRWTHRIAGLVLLLIGLYHVIYVVTSKDGRRLLRDFFPVKKDVTDALAGARYLAGVTGEKPRFGRFGYPEKMEYWAVAWGIIIMGVTGLMIWFKIDVTQFLPRWLVDVALTIHYYEAVLACLAILVWHFYHVIFDPDVYPLNLACWDGKVSKHWQDEEHPLDPATTGGDAPAAKDAEG